MYCAHNKKRLLFFQGAHENVFHFIHILLITINYSYTFCGSPGFGETAVVKVIRNGENLATKPKQALIYASQAESGG